MATSIDALLNIRANVSGEGPVKAMGAAIGGIRGAAGQASGALQGMAGKVGGLAGAMGTLTPLLSAAGLVALAVGSVNAGDALSKMSLRTGVAVEELSRFKQAADLSDTSIQAVGKALAIMSKNMENAASVDLGGKTKAEIDKMVKAVQDGEKKQTQAIEKEADRRMTALDKETDRRLTALNKRYRREEQLLKDTWDDQAEAEDSAADDRLEAQLKAIERSYSARRKALEKDQQLTEEQKEAQLNALQDAYDAETDKLRDSYAAAQKVRDRARRDEQQATLDALEAKKQAEADALKAAAEEQKGIIKEQTTYQVETVRAATTATIAELKRDPGESALVQELEQLGLSGKGAGRAFQELGIAIKNQDGTLRNSGEVMYDVADAFQGMEDGPKKAALAMAIFGKSGVELIPMLNMGGEAIRAFDANVSTDFATRAAAYNDQMTILGTRVQEFGMSLMNVLMPALSAVTAVLINFAEWFKTLPEWMQGTLSALALLTITLTALAPLISALVGLVGPVLAWLVSASGAAAALSAALATVAGWLGALGPALTAVGAAIAGFLTWPVLLGAAIVAAIAAIWIFRDDIAKFFQDVGELAVYMVENMGETLAYVGEIWGNIFSGLAEIAGAAFNATLEFAAAAFETMLQFFYDVFAEPYVKLWGQLQEVGAQLLTGLQTGWGKFTTWIAGVFKGIGDTFNRFIRDPIVKAWQAITEAAKAPLRGLMSFAVSVLNTVIRAINKVIDGINALRSKIGLSTFGKIGELSVPKFAEGGYVNGPTLGLVGEAGAEYIVPERKAAAFASNIMAGARGAAAIPSSSSGGSGPASVTVNLTTGPVLQQPDGTRAVALEDVERLVRQGVSETMRQLRTPGGRYAVGVR